MRSKAVEFFDQRRQAPRIAFRPPGGRVIADELPADGSFRPNSPRVQPRSVSLKYKTMAKRAPRPTNRTGARVGLRRRVSDPAAVPKDLSEPERGEVRCAPQSTKVKKCHTCKEKRLRAAFSVSRSDLDDGTVAAEFTRGFRDAYRSVAGAGGTGRREGGSVAAQPPCEKRTNASAGTADL